MMLAFHLYLLPPTRGFMEQTILIIDDSEDDIILMQMVLEKIKAQVRTETALSGEQGLALLRHGHPLPSLVLLDLKMPGIDGFDILRAMRNNDRLRHIPVIVMTHSNLSSDEEACFLAGANSFLHKSVDFNRFAVEIQKELKRWMRS